MNAIIAYFANDVSDPAVHRMVHALINGGADVKLMGFRRSAEPVTLVHGIKPLDFGQTVNSQLGARALSVLRERFIRRSYQDQLQDVNVILARNLECLILADDAHALCKGVPSLIYECLDIHRVMVGNSARARFMRGVEAKAMKPISGLIVSSPAFMREHFRGYSLTSAPYLLAENKFRETVPSAAEKKRLAGPPWRIGWFGMLRCTKSLQMLSQISSTLEGRLEVVIRGKIMHADQQPFHDLVAQSKYVRYEGPYSYADVPQIYSEVHYAWTIDYFQEGQNSAWLLPNRLYESIAQGAVPIALESVETANWLKAHHCGVLVDDPTTDLINFFKSARPEDYQEQCEKVAAVPRSDVIATDKGDAELVDFLLNPRRVGK